MDRIATSAEKSTERCPVCGSRVRRWGRKTTRSAEFRLLRCHGCGFAFALPRPTLAWLNDYYAGRGASGGTGQTEERHPDPRATCEEYLAREAEEPCAVLDASRVVGTLLELIGPRPRQAKSSLLDVGCGYGIYSREALRQGFGVTAIEPAPQPRSVAAELIGFEPLDVEFERFEWQGYLFDAIILSQVLEHALDVNAWARKAWDLIRPGGVVAVCLPNFNSVFRRVLGSSDPYISPPEHLNYFSRRSLGRLLAKHGFRVERTQWVSRFPARALTKRLPWFERHGVFLDLAMEGIDAISTALDRMRLGMIVDVYGRKLR